jgi:hypothetical protein
MTEPKRLVEELRDPSLVRALHAGIELAPPPGAETAVWAALQTAVAAGAGASLAAPGGTKGLGVFGKGFLAGKWWLSLFALALLGGGLFALRASRDSAPTVLRANDSVEQQIAPEPSSAANDRTGDVPRIDIEELGREAKPRQTERGPPPSRASSTSEPTNTEPLDEVSQVDPGSGVTEGELVLGARKALRSGRAGEALELVARTRREFPSGALAQERDAIEVEALARSGASEEARDRARAFLTRYPASPYAKNVEAVLRDAVPR